MVSHRTTFKRCRPDDDDEDDGDRPHAELGSVSESQIRRAGRWNTDVMTGVYLSYLPREFIRSIADFPQEEKAYFFPRARETPEEVLSTQIWLETDIWLQRMEVYHSDRTDNEVVRLNLAGSRFLRLRTLRVVLLQNSVILRQRFPSTLYERTRYSIVRNIEDLRRG